MEVRNSNNNNNNRENLKSNDRKSERDRKNGNESYDVSWDLSNTNMTNFERSDRLPDKLETIREESDRRHLSLGHKVEIEDNDLFKPRFEGN